VAVRSLQPKHIRVRLVERIGGLVESTLESCSLSEVLPCRCRDRCLGAKLIKISIADPNSLRHRAVHGTQPVQFVLHLADHVRVPYSFNGCPVGI
jgi:hypothetical protein